MFAKGKRGIAIGKSAFVAPGASAPDIPDGLVAFDHVLPQINRQAFARDIDQLGHDIGIINACAQ